jgi:TetR/AcrR family transcriptional repressor of nem operon
MENRKTQIVNLTLDLIRDKGFVAISYDDISKQLGITKASIHYHFEKKEDLAIAVADRIQLNLQNVFVSLDSTPTSVKEKIMKFIATRVEQGGNGICPISSLQTDYESLPEVVRQKVQEISQLELSVLIEILKGEYEEDHAESLAFAILSCLKGALQYKRVLGKDILPQVIYQINRLI